MTDRPLAKGVSPATMAVLLLSVFTLEPFGFIPAAAVLFLLTAHGLGSHRWLRDLLIGVALSAVAYVLFSKGLGLRLPAGTLLLDSRYRARGDPGGRAQ